MNEEILLIHNALSSQDAPLTTGQISKKIFIASGLKLSSKTVQNYLWSFFRHDITYNKESYTYQYKPLRSYNWDEIIVEGSCKTKRPISATVVGRTLRIVYDNNISLNEFLEAFAVLSLTKGGKKEIDILKSLNRIIECRK